MALDRIGSGEVHIYRGVVSGTGACYVALAKAAIESMAAAGAITLSDMEDEIAAVDHLASSSG